MTENLIPTTEQWRSGNSLYFPETLTENCLLFDGLTRVGKGLVAPLVSDLRGVEYAQIVTVVEHIPVLWRLGLLDGQSAAAFLRITVDSFTYERAVGRNLNTRFSDISSIYRSLSAKELLDRALGDEGKAAIDRFNADGRISSFVTHFNLPMAELWFKAFPKLRILLTVRHPVDVIYSWHGRGWGERWGKDPLGFSLVPDVNGEPVPWFALVFAEEYQRDTAINRDVKCVLALNQMYDEALRSLDDKQKNRVEIVSFERMATAPMSELERLAAWLGTTLRPEMPVAMARERVPRKLNIEDRRLKFATMKKEIDEDLLERLLSISRDYESRWELESFDSTGDTI